METPNIAPWLPVGSKVNAPLTLPRTASHEVRAAPDAQPLLRLRYSIKPRERVSFHEVLTETGYGSAISAYLGPERARAISVLLSRDQNIVIVHTPDIEAADRLIGELAVNTEKGSIPLQCYLRQGGGNTCHGVIVVRNTDTTETLQHRVCWRTGTIVENPKIRHIQQGTHHLLG
ncbi:hypothetical protein IscW_ISCW012682 [Ixodes scapularis]|uniref:Uncharacterized protein n=1 Tax=Ixodes scapularis TaxID=6945 RepID=B7QBJ4_IXOSC|nr:hypothetical protein IscW_ISCW012682 [Ixodes scapularis]|eukprot:XP_002412920.1 hypothetical protein IscW_ISCW012682 [Ixodes scapularis]